MLVSIITVSFNSEGTIKETIESVNKQTFKDIEHVFVDGGSKDSTVDIIKRCSIRRPCLKSESDNGIYDAMNKGFARSNGDVVAFLNSDDAYVDERVIDDVVSCFRDSGVDYVYGNICFVNGESGRVVRTWTSGKSLEKSIRGKQIPHPALFVKREVLSKVEGPFDPKYKISSDLKQQLIFIDKIGCSGKYLNRVITNMKIGGTSTSSIFAYWQGWKESRSVYNEVFGGGGTIYTMRKVFSKLLG